MRRARGQVVIIFAAALPVLLGFIGLALDGGLYYALHRGAQFAASAAARAAAQEVQAGRYSGATTVGQTIGQKNLNGFQLTSPTVTLAFNDTVNATPTSAGWGPTAQASTASVMATVTATYPTRLLGFVGVPTADLRQWTVVTLQGAGPLPNVVVPLAICQSVSAAMDANPAVPQTIWRLSGNTCGVPKWDGLIGIGNKDDCANYQRLIQPAPSAVPPAIGTTIPLSTKDCKDIEKWMNPYTNKIVWIAVVGTNPTTLTGTILCYRQVTFNASTKDLVTAVPTSTPPICGSLRETI